MSEHLKIYLDMDGVLANFDKRYDELCGGRDKRPPPGEDERGFWAPVLASPNFWLSLEAMPGAEFIWRRLLGHPYLVVLTSPGTHDRERAMRHKRLWAAEHLGQGVNIVFKKEKHHYACPNSLLIDDWRKNVDAWREAGGKAILHRDPMDTLLRLDDLGLKGRGHL